MRLKIGPGLALLMLPGGALAQAAETEQRVGAHGLALPASFAGVLPCADCPGIRYKLDIWPQGGFALQRDYIDRDAGVTAMGRWHVDPARSALVLTGPEAQEWQILGNGQLRLMGQDGQPIESDLPHELTPGPLAPFDLSLPMTGEFTYFADAALFRECMTGQVMPVVMEGAYIELERAYLEARPAPAAPLLARIEGRLAEAPQMEGPPRRSVTVEEFHHVTPGGACAETRPAAEMLNTFWRLHEIDDTDLPADLPRREPYLLLLDTEDARFSATVGCNMLLGGFALEGEALSFGPAASTLMACPPGLDSLETALRDVLAEVAAFDSDGHVLRLRDDAGRVRARLGAVHTPHH